jgi:hypothetical protein
MTSAQDQFSDFNPEISNFSDREQLRMSVKYGIKKSFLPSSGGRKLKNLVYSGCPTCGHDTP